MEKAMSDFNCAYVRGHYIGAILDSDPKKRIRNYHPT